jgi:hypothetical protein
VSEFRYPPRLGLPWALVLARPPSYARSNRAAGGTGTANFPVIGPLTGGFRDRPAKTRGSAGTGNGDPLMQRSIAPISLAAVAAIFLAGCSGPAPSSTAEPSGSTSASSDAAPSSAAPETSSTPEPPSASAAPTSAAKTYTNEDLTAIVAGLKDAQGRALTVVPAAQMDQGLIVARELLKNAVITPKACGVLADNNTQVPEGSTYAAGASLAAAAKTATIVTVFAVKDPAVMTTQFDKSEAAVRNCSTYTFELKGQKITSAMKPVDVAVEADKSVTALQTQTLPTGQKQAVLTVTGVKGTLAATVVKTGAAGAVTASAAPELAKLVNAALAAG